MAVRLGIVADIHANLQALDTVLAYLDAESVDAIWCLGDVVGYGGDPAACVAIVRDRCAGTVRGNHDVAVIDERWRVGFNPYARAAIERQAVLLGDDEKGWLASLPARLDADGAALAHSGFADPDAFEYVLTALDARVELRALDRRIGFVGHTHVPAAWREAADGDVMPVALPERRPLDLEAQRWLVNPGAVGQPRDGDPRAACAIYDAGRGVVEHARIAYDIAGAQAAIARAGMPVIQAVRLAHGQ
jgi:diadenosine tetraphosphatase ApaH/serine/threonine PP2A family protein phosphatase